MQLASRDGRRETEGEASQPISQVRTRLKWLCARCHGSGKDADEIEEVELIWDMTVTCST